jgi:hypothetical protein
MAAPPEGSVACPVCWTAVRPGARVCPSCRSPLGQAAAAAPEAASRGRVVPQARGEDKPARWRPGPWVTVAVAVVALLTALTIKVVSGLLPPPAEYGAATGNVGPRTAVTPATAAKALLAFQPAGDVEDLGIAMAYATRDTGTLPSRITQISVRPGPGQSQLVTVSVPVNVAFLRKVHAIETRYTLNVSNLKTGQLFVNAADDNAYGIVMNPKTHIAVFAFRLSANDGSVWGTNLNAVQVISQTQSLG